MEKAKLSKVLIVMQSKRENMFRKLQVLYDRSRDLSSEGKIKEFLIRCRVLDELKNQFETVVEEWNMANLELDENFNPSFQEIIAFEDLYFKIKEVLEDLIGTTGTESGSASKPPTAARPKLPKIDLVEFDGDPLKWPLFYETFKSLVHENQNLDPVSKIHYLLGKLKGQARALSDGILPSADNYTVLWQALIDKYEDKRALASLYWKQILDFKPSSEENVANLQRYQERVDVSANSLFKLNLDNLGDFLLTSVCLNRLNRTTRLLFEQTLPTNEFPTFAQLSSFVKERTKVLSRVEPVSSNRAIFKTKPAIMHALVVKKGESKPQSGKNCLMCQGTNHLIHKCYKFLKLSQEERLKFITNNNLCINCLKKGHSWHHCSSTYSCQYCNEKHHSALHQEKEKGEITTKTAHSKTPEISKEQSVSLTSTNDNSHKQPYTVALATAVVLVKAKSGENVRMRVLIDSASQCNFITKQFSTKLGLTIQSTSASISGIGSVRQKIDGETYVHFTSRYDAHKEFEVKALVIEQITGLLPTRQVDPAVAKRLQMFRLADDTFDTPGNIDGMIGAELFPTILNGKKISIAGLPTLLESPLGVIVMGKLPAKFIHETPESTTYDAYCCTESPSSLETLIPKFWELEDIMERPKSDPDDVICEELFKSTVRREPEGRYVVGLPFCSDVPALGNSYEAALRRLFALERRFEKDQTFKSNYAAVIQDYLEQDHMRLVSPASQKSPGYFIPHHGVVKLSSSSTPLRVVFDASCKTSNGKSLNDVLYTGTKLQNDIFEILLRFRLFKIAMTADVRQMYRQIKILPQHQRYQRILWRFSREDPIACYELTTVTFGLKPSPFLALRTLAQLATDEHDRFPLAAERLQREIYMDDVVSSVETEEEALELHQQWVGLLKAGGFDLVKWASNSKNLLQKIPATLKREDLVDFPSEFLKVLGLQWNAKEDILLFRVKSTENKFTKRGILSTIARIWDPLGLLAPITVWAKILMQELWQLKLSWDDELPEEIRKKWSKFLEEMIILADYQVPRYLGAQKGKVHVLVGFADASERAYAAVIYLWVGNEEGIGKAELLCAKSKVAPQKTISLPRLELCAALLLAKLGDAVSRAYQSHCQIEKFIAFSDSTVSLHWISSSPHRWKSFVATRVTKIQKVIPPENWFHVKSEENPADLASRGLSPKQFLNDTHWNSGPSWLSNRQDWALTRKWESQNVELEKETLKEGKKETCLVAQEEESAIQELIQRCGSWRKLLRTTVYLLRFMKKLPRNNQIQASDLETAEVFLIKNVQKRHFEQEIRMLKNGKETHKELRLLRPFLHQDLLRVGGRLTNASVSYDQQHPVLLPRKERLCELLVDHLHETNLHAGPTLLLSTLRQRYWILGARNLVRLRCQQCNRCFRCKPKLPTTLMADLPAPRVAQVKPFLHTGVDFGGPFKLTLSRHRGVKTQKGYLCLFVCLSTKAIHLECASDLSTECFLAAFQRFLARRGPCSVIYSDQGTNFVGAKNYLKELYDVWDSKEFKEKMQHWFAESRIEWRLNPPASPHFGGLWEAGIKSVKYHLVRVVGDQILTFEEFSTVLCQIEGILNSRPLCWLSTDPAEPSVLTPAHFLNLTPLKSFPNLGIESTISNRLQRKQLLDQIVQNYWSRWQKEYLSTLQARRKWNSQTTPITPGLLVLISLDNTPPLHWPLGLIEEVYPGKDGEVRVALVKTKNGTFKRPIVKLAPLPTQ